MYGMGVVRIPAQAGHRFQSNPDSDSRGKLDSDSKAKASAQAMRQAASGDGASRYSEFNRKDRSFSKGDDP